VDQTLIPEAASPGGADVIAVCGATSVPACTDAMAVAAPAGERSYYQVRALCDGLEGP